MYLIVIIFIIVIVLYFVYLLFSNNELHILKEGQKCPDCLNYITRKTKTCPKCPQCPQCPKCPKCEGRDCPQCPTCPPCPPCDLKECPPCRTCPACPKCEGRQCPKCEPCPPCINCSQVECPKCPTCTPCPTCPTCPTCQDCTCPPCPSCPTCPTCPECPPIKECCFPPGQDDIPRISLKNKPEIKGTLADKNLIARFPNAGTVKDKQVEVLIKIIEYTGKVDKIDFKEPFGIYISGTAPTVVKAQVIIVEKGTENPVESSYSFEIGNIGKRTNTEYVEIDNKCVYSYGYNRDTTLEITESEDNTKIKSKGTTSRGSSLRQCSNKDSRGVDCKQCQSGDPITDSGLAFMINTEEKCAGFNITFGQDGTAAFTDSVQYISGDYEAIFGCKKP